MRPSILLRAVASVALAAILNGCGSAATPSPTNNVHWVNTYDDPQNPHK